MRTERQMGFAQLEGTLMEHQISTSDPAFTTLKELESKVGNMTSEHISLLVQLIDRVVIARNAAIKRKLIATIEKIQL